MRSTRASFVLVTSAFFFFFICVGIQTVKATTPPPSPPADLPNKFFDPNVTSDVGFGLISGPMWYDADFGADRIDFKVNFAPGYRGNYTSISDNVTSYFILDEVCRILPDAAAFQSLFSWLQFSTYNGQITIEGRLCNEWTLFVPQLGGDLILDVLASNDSIPVRFIAPFKPFTTNQLTNVTYIFSTEFSIEAVNVSVFDVPDGCYHKEVCPAGPTINTTMYLFHDADDFTLINTNVADKLGDIGFVCFALLSDSFTYFSWLSEYEVEFNTTYGQYGLCNFGSCIGGAEDRIGKEVAEGLAPYGGQCENNTILGNWFSLPSYNSSLCPEYANGTIGINGTEWYGCGWNVINKLRTIDGNCLNQNGFLEACETDGTYPFPTAQKIWDAAFASEDPSMGGCPEIGPQSNATRPIKIGDARNNKEMTTESLYQMRNHIQNAIALALASKNTH